MRVGSAVGAGFLVICIALSGVIPRLYGLSESLLVPLAWMALSVFPALFLNLLFTYYNTADMDLWSNRLIFLRQILMTWIGLRLVFATGFSVFSFLLFAELSTVALWWCATGIHHLRRPQDSRYLVTDLEREKRGQVLNFSVSADVNEIVSASERIGAFCEANGLSDREIMQLEMSMEEVMTLICQVNAGKVIQDLRFDLRAYSIKDSRGIRIRYSGIAFNPFNFTSTPESIEDDMYMGVRMIWKMVKSVNYQSAFGVNTLQILLKEGQTNET